MNTSLLIFIKKISAFILLLFILDYAIGRVMEHYYYKIDAHTPEQHTTYSIKYADAEIMIFGSSRAQHHYDPGSFTSSSLTFYNTGKDGQGIFYSLAILKSLLSRSSSPKIIILDINPNEFSKNQDSYDRLAELLHYYNDHDEIQAIVNLKSPFEKIKALSSLYRYNSKILTIIKDNISPSDDDMEYGYEPIKTIDRKLDLVDIEDQANIDSLEVEAFENFLIDARNAGHEMYVFILPVYRRFSYVSTIDIFDIEEQANIDSLEVEAFENFLIDARNAGHEMYVFISPVYRRFPHGTTTSIAITQQLCEQLNIPFYSYHLNEHFLSHPQYFSDPTHLNEIGAKKFSDQVFSILAGDGAINRLKKSAVEN